ncbi:MAG: 2-C-methyl-D-erythritol 4-phosphate cytidylyltransferase [Ilumatobacteraceae bacterium]|nr:2-C-methyl-D-erythritol 4-phosphate cytidylyltransferase [Ilumatobacteraceae bacterium]
MTSVTVLPCDGVSNAGPNGPERVWTIVVAGGSGSRFGAPKQYAALGDERVIDRSRRVAAHVSDGVVVVVPAADAAREQGIPGGDTRTASVRNGLAAVPADATIICVHDAARPLVDVDVYTRVIAGVHAGADGVVPVVPVVDTIKVVDGDRVIETPAREQLVAVQTPQGFRAEVLRAAYAGAIDAASDDAALVEKGGGVVRVVPGSDDARKITHPDDLAWARQRVAEGAHR